MTLPSIPKAISTVFADYPINHHFLDEVFTRERKINDHY